jgi:hypothetical protein
MHVAAVNYSTRSTEVIKMGFMATDEASAPDIPSTKRA